MTAAPREPLGWVLICLSVSAAGVCLWASHPAGEYRDPSLHGLYLVMGLGGFAGAVLAKLTGDIRDD